MRGEKQDESGISPKTAGDPTQIRLPATEDTNKEKQKQHKLTDEWKLAGC